MAGEAHRQIEIAQEIEPNRGQLLVVAARLELVDEVVAINFAILLLLHKAAIGVGAHVAIAFPVVDRGDEGRVFAVGAVENVDAPVFRKLEGCGLVAEVVVELEGHGLVFRGHAFLRPEAPGLLALPALRFCDCHNLILPFACPRFLQRSACQNSHI